MALNSAHRDHADDCAEGDDEAADPHPDHQRADQDFERGLIAVHFAEAGEDQINVFAQAAPMHGAADGRLLGREEFQRRCDDAFVLAIVKDAKRSVNAEVGRLLGAVESFELNPVVADIERID